MTTTAGAIKEGISDCPECGVMNSSYIYKSTLNGEEITVKSMLCQCGYCSQEILD